MGLDKAARRAQAGFMTEPAATSEVRQPDPEAHGDGRKHVRESLESDAKSDDSLARLDEVGPGDTYVPV